MSTNKRQGWGSRAEGKQVKVRAYGELADLLGRERYVEIAAPCTVAELRAHLAAQCPEAAAPLANRRVLACVRDVSVPDGYVVTEDEAVELLAPVSGG